MGRKSKIPKRIGGIKIPKKVRKGPVGQFFRSSAGQLILGQALLIAGGMYAAKKVDRDSPMARAVRHPGDTVAKAFDGRSPKDISARLSYACGEAMKAFFEALQAGQNRDTPTSVSGEREPAREERGKKKSEGSRETSTSTPH